MEPPQSVGASVCAVPNSTPPWMWVAPMFLPSCETSPPEIATPPPVMLIVTFEATKLCDPVAQERTSE